MTTTKTTAGSAAAASRSPALRRAMPWFAPLAIGLALGLAYANSFRGPFLFDDIPAIVENPTIRGLATGLFPPADSAATVSGRPLTNLSLAFNYAVGGLSVTGYHVVNLAIHFAAALALFGVVRRTLSLPGPGARLGAVSGEVALAAALLWSLHPLQTESVTYVVQRAEAMGGAFYFLTLYAFVRAVGAEPGRRARWEAAAVAACAFGMASKEVVVTAPLVVLLFDRTFAAGSFSAAWSARRRVHLSLMATWVVLGVCLYAAGDRGASAGIGAGVSPWRYLLTQCHAITHYLRLAFWPDALVLDYGWVFVAGLAEVWWRAVLLVAAFGAVCVASWRKSAWGFVGVFFFAALAPSSSVMPLLDSLFEHRMYLALASLVVAVVVVMYLRLPRYAPLACAALAVALGVVTHLRNRDYRSAEAMWSDTVAKQPENSRAWFSLGHTFKDQARFAEARDAFARARELNPGSASIAIDYAGVLAATGERGRALELYREGLRTLPADHRARREALHNLGLLLAESGRAEEGLSYLAEGVRSRPDDWETRVALGRVLASLGRLDEARVELERVVAAKPEQDLARIALADVWRGLGREAEALTVLRAGLVYSAKSEPLRVRLGSALIAGGDVAGGVAQFESVLRDNPRSVQANLDLGFALMGRGEAAKARGYFEAASRLTPREPLIHVALARACLQSGGPAEAFAHFETALALAPSDLEIRYSYARTLRESGRGAESVPQYEALLRAAPASPQVHHELALAHLQLGKRAEARAHLAEALRLRPDFDEARESLRKIEASD